MLVFPDPLHAGTAPSAAAAQALFSLASAALKGENARPAVAVCRAGLVVAPDVGPGWGNLMSAWRRADRADQAVAAARRALTLMPQSAELRLVLAMTLSGGPGATREARLAAVLAPEVAVVWFQLAKLSPSGRSALACYARALRVRPDWAEARMNLGLLQLHLGDLAAGWHNKDSRWIVPGSGATIRLTRPLWHGEKLAGKRLAVLREQGIGDQFFYASVLGDVLRQGGRVLVECDHRLVTLFSRSFPTATVVPPDDARLHAVDYQIPIGGLMRLFRPSIESFAEPQAYLTAEPLRAELWRRRLDALGAGRKIGVCWRSRLRDAGRADNVSTIEEWGPILQARAGDIFVNLQYDECEAEIATARRLFGVELHGWSDLDRMNDFESVAALIVGLDLVVTITTNICEFAGALGRPVWALSPQVWSHFGTTTLPYYPRARCFIKERGAAWTATMQDVARALRDDTI